MASTEVQLPAGEHRKAGLTLAALGIVFGDIGTSPLYTMAVCFGSHTGIQATQDNILGMLSLITWALIIVVTIKYVWVVMRADNHGEGGILILMALLMQSRSLSRGQRQIYLALGAAGAALFYSDCLLTPAISILSAVEGLRLVRPDLASLVVPISVGLVLALFALQRFGTNRIGYLFGPIMLIWYAVLVALGLVHIMDRPGVLAAFSPSYAYTFASKNTFAAFVALGAVTLSFTGAEALYANMGEFGRTTIRIEWLYIVAPALLVNYYGQGALLILDPTAIEHPFFRLAQPWALYPLVSLATAAAVIASQATISGAAAMTRQASALGLCPKLDRQSCSTPGNWPQMLGVLSLVIIFASSSNLASAYGIAVTGSMLVTTVLISALARCRWTWGWLRVLSVFGFFLVVDTSLVSANLLKVLHGGWLSLTIALVLFIAMLRGRSLHPMPCSEQSGTESKSNQKKPPLKEDRPRQSSI